MRTHKINCSGNGQHMREPVRIQTTLYELVETVIDVVGPDKKQLITAVLLDMLRKGRANVRVSETTSI